MPKIRIYYEDKIKKDVEIIPTRSQLHYLTKVMRKKVDDYIYLFNSIDGEWKTKIDQQNILKLIPKQQLKKNNFLDLNDVWVFVGLTKPKTLKYLVEKGSEVGVSKIIPLKTEYSYKAKINVERYKKIIIEAVEQSEGLKIPDIENVKTIQEALSGWDKKRMIVFCDEKEPKNRLLEVFMNNYKSKMGIFLGPVGGWSNLDRSFFQKSSNYLSVSLGKRLLKVDTAMIYSLSCYSEVLEYKNEK